MKAIRFSSEYVKMPDLYSPSTLIQVFVTRFDELSPEFVEYDTRKTDGTHYPLPQTDLIVLLLMGPSGDLWTTIRRYTNRKYDYYLSMVGKTFSIEVLE